MEETVFQPAVAWEPTDQTRVDLIFLYTERDAFGERRRGTPDLEGDFFALSEDFTYNEPDDRNDVEIFSVDALLTHEFSEDLRFNGGFRYFTDENVQEYHEPRAGVYPTLPYSTSPTSSRHSPAWDCYHRRRSSAFTGGWACTWGSCCL